MDFAVLPATESHLPCTKHESTVTYHLLSAAHVLAAACGCSSRPRVQSPSSLDVHGPEPRVHRVVLPPAPRQCWLTVLSFAFFPQTFSTSFLVFTPPDTKKVEAIRRELPRTGPFLQVGPAVGAWPAPRRPCATAAHSPLLDLTVRSVRAGPPDASLCVCLTSSRGTSSAFLCKACPRAHEA